MGQCPRHGKALNLFCKEDDTICCDMCITRKHRSCQEVVYLPTFAKSFLKYIDESGVKTKLRKNIEQLGSIKIKQYDTLSSLQEDLDKYLKEVNDQHKELLDFLEQIVQSSKEHIKQTFESFRVAVQRHQHEVETCLVDLESSEELLERNHDNDFTVFQGLDKYQKQLKVAEEISTVSLDNLKVRGFSVSVDDRVHSLLSELETLVTVLKQAPVQVKKKYQVDVSSKDDQKTCWIYGFCLLWDGTILIADYSNQKLKCIDQQSLQVKNQCPMESFPIDVCVINRSEVAVTQGNNTVVIVSVNPRLTPTRTIEMNHFCEYVAYSQGELYITDKDKSLYIHNMEGTLLMKVSTDHAGQNIFSIIHHVMISGTDKVYIADWDEDVIILDREGQVLDKLAIDKIRGADALCLDGIGGLFLCGDVSNNVLHVGADGQIVNEVLTGSDGLVEPLSVCYDSLRKRLIVTQFNSNQIHVCEME